MNQKLNLQHLPIETLIPYARNARTHTPSQVSQIVRSIEAFGFINPVLIDTEKTIIAGHARVLAAREIGLEHVPVIRVEHLTEDEKRAYILADNKLAENAGWNEDLLRVELEYLTQVDIDIDVDLTGFSVPEIDIHLGQADEKNFEEPLLFPPSDNPDDVITRPGDLWFLGPHRLLCGDCRDDAVMGEVMGNKEARMVITDPPYNVPIDGHVSGLGKHQHPEFAMACGEMSPKAFTTFLTECLGELARWCVDGSLYFIFMDWRHLQELITAGNQVFDSMLNLCVWNKTNGGMGSLYRSQHELVLVFKKGKAPHLNNVELGKHGRYRTNVWTYPGVNSFGKERDEALAMHPTVKPLRMIADAILDASGQGDIILDGFLGSGTTLLAAEQTHRICHGVEIEPRYVDVTLQRWINLTGIQPIHAGLNCNFSELAEGKQLRQASGE